MASARKETERTKFIQDKCQTLLTQMLRDEDNKYCVDCDAKGPRWASWNLGVFLCIRCAGIHRNLGVHISRVRSVNLDTWTPEQVMSLQNMGNSRARAIYEAQLPDGFRRPQTDSGLESFVRGKYEHKKYMAREYVPTAPAVANWDKEIDEEMERQKRSKKKTATGSLGASISALTTDKKPLASAKTSTPIALAKPAQSPKSSKIISQPPAVTSASADLLGLCSPPAPTTTATTNGTKSEAADIVGDIFSSFFSGPTPTSTTSVGTPPKTANPTKPNNGSGVQNVSLAKQEEDFFNQVAPTEQEKGKLTRDSIMALYAKAPTGGAGGGFNQFNGAPAGPTAFMPHQPQQQSQHPHQMGGFGGIPNSNQFSNAQLLSQLGVVSSVPGGASGFSMPQMNSNNQSAFGTFGSPQQQQQQPQHQQQMPSFAQFPPMQQSAFPVAAGAPNGFGATSSTMHVAPPAAQSAGINQQFANLNMWQ